MRSTTSESPGSRKVNVQAKMHSAITQEMTIGLTRFGVLLIESNQCGCDYPGIQFLAVEVQVLILKIILELRAGDVFEHARRWYSSEGSAGLYNGRHPLAVGYDF